MCHRGSEPGAKGVKLCGLPSPGEREGKTRRRGRSGGRFGQQPKWNAVTGFKASLSRST